MSFSISLIAIATALLVLYKTMAMQQKIHRLSLQCTQSLQEPDVEDIIRYFLENPKHQEYLSARAQSWLPVAEDDDQDTDTEVAADDPVSELD